MNFSQKQTSFSTSSKYGVIHTLLQWSSLGSLQSELPNVMFWLLSNTNFLQTLGQLQSYRLSTMQWCNSEGEHLHLIWQMASAVLARA